MIALARCRAAIHTAKQSKLQLEKHLQSLPLLELGRLQD